MLQRLHFSFVAMGVILLCSTAKLYAQTYLNYAVNQPAVLDAQAGNDQLICQGAEATLGGNPTASGGYGGYVYTWTPTTGLNTATAANPTSMPNASTTYFLSITDSLGCTAFDTMTVALDTCVGLIPGVGIASFEVYPNPSTGRITISVAMEQATDLILLEVIDISGKVVLRKQFSQPTLVLNEQLQLDGLAKGSYTIQMQADGQKVSRKMILQ
jgi:hypothetical protein